MDCTADAFESNSWDTSITKPCVKHQQMKPAQNLPTRSALLRAATTYTCYLIVASMYTCVHPPPLCSFLCTTNLDIHVWGMTDAVSCALKWQLNSLSADLLWPRAHNMMDAGSTRRVAMICQQLLSLPACRMQWPCWHRQSGADADEWPSIPPAFADQSSGLLACQAICSFVLFDMLSGIHATEFVNVKIAFRAYGLHHF